MTYHDWKLRNKFARSGSALAARAGFVIEELSEMPSSWRSEQNRCRLSSPWEIPGVQGIDTRRYAASLERGAMKACLTSDASLGQGSDAAERCK